MIGSVSPDDSSDYIPTDVYDFVPDSDEVDIPVDSSLISRHKGKSQTSATSPTCSSWSESPIVIGSVSVSPDDSSDYIPTDVFIPDSIEDCEDDIPVEEASLHSSLISRHKEVTNSSVLSLPDWSQSSQATTREKQNNINASTTAMRKPCQLNSHTQDDLESYHYKEPDVQRILELKRQFLASNKPDKSIDVVNQCVNLSFAFVATTVTVCLC